MLVRKNDIINILSETRLASGDFINAYGQPCAVGAIVRYFYGCPDHEVVSISEALAPAAQRQSSKPYLQSGDYLSALSIHFENVMYAYDDVYTEEVRDEVLNFVALHFPEEIVVNV